MNTAVAKQEEKKISISNFLNTPKTAVFLEQTLGNHQRLFDQRKWTSVRPRPNAVHEHL